jgi:hypothetical protein
MNYFAHGRDFLQDPYFLAGTAVPDWLSVIDRRLRVKSKHAAPFVTHADARIAALAAGILQHYRDDRWFHSTRAFAEVSWHLTVAIRDVLPDDDGFRPSFLGHILVEVLLDASLIADAPRQLDAYYAALEQLAPATVTDGISHMANRSAEPLTAFIPGFCAERFLYDYLDDAKLLSRLNRVMRRVKLRPLPDQFVELLWPARRLVYERQAELLAGGEARVGATPVPPPRLNHTTGDLP